MNKPETLRRSDAPIGRRDAPSRRGAASAGGQPARGFTLIELMVTIAIAAILIAMAVPSFQSMLVNNRMSAATNGLFNALNYARNAALTGNTTVLVCPVGAFGSTACGANWPSGWMAVNTGVAPPLLLQSWTLAANAPALTSPSGTASVTFNSRGITSGNAANFKLCDSRGANYARSLQVMATGLVQVSPTGGAGLTNGTAVWGGALTCP
jgi:type IV fimbrial biogenesis protein FimT